MVLRGNENNGKKLWAKKWKKDGIKGFTIKKTIL